MLEDALGSVLGRHRVGVCASPLAVACSELLGDRLLDRIGVNSVTVAQLAAHLRMRPRGVAAHGVIDVGVLGGSRHVVPHRGLRGHVAVSPPLRVLDGGEPRASERGGGGRLTLGCRQALPLLTDGALLMVDLLHVAAMLKRNGGVPAFGNQRTEWDAGCRPDFPNPEHR